MTGESFSYDHGVDAGELDMRGGNVLKLNHAVLLGSFGLGNPNSTIGIETRDDIDVEVLNASFEALASAEFNVPVSDSVPVVCIDGRFNENGTREDAPSGAGGSLTGTYGVALAGSGLYVAKNELELVQATFGVLQGSGNRVGVHGDNHSACGCGACAQAKTIFGNIPSAFDSISQLAGAINIDINPDRDRIINNAARLADESSGFFADDRSQVLETARNAEGSVNEIVVDDHLEVVGAVNMRPNTTVSRVAYRNYVCTLLMERGMDQEAAIKQASRYEMFVIDAWSLPNMAQTLAQTGYESDQRSLLNAMTVQNIATSSHLAHPSLPLVVVS